MFGIRNLFFFVFCKNKFVLLLFLPGLAPSMRGGAQVCVLACVTIMGARSGIDLGL